MAALSNTELRMMSSTQIADVGSIPTEPDAASTPVPLHLPGSPRNTIGGYLRLEDTLNALGRHDHPETWGRLPGWSHMPFRWVRTEKQYVRHIFRLKGTEALLRRIPVKLEFRATERRACTQLYRVVRTTMIEALEAGRLKAHAWHHVRGDVTPIMAPGVWQTQYLPIFYTGRMVIREGNAPDQLAYVIIQQDAFDHWMETRRKKRMKDTSGATLREAGRIIRAHALEHDYGITHVEAFAIFTLAARQHGREVSGRQFEKLAWAECGAKAGRPPTVRKERFAQHRADLVARLTALFEGSSIG